MQLSSAALPLTKRVCPSPYLRMQDMTTSVPTVCTFHLKCFPFCTLPCPPAPAVCRKGKHALPCPPAPAVCRTSWLGGAPCKLLDTHAARSQTSPISVRVRIPMWQGPRPPRFGLGLGHPCGKVPDLPDIHEASQVSIDLLELSVCS